MTVLSGEAVALSESSTHFAKLPVNDTDKHFLYVEWQLGDEKYSNHYMTNIKDIDYREYLSYLERVGYDSFEGFSDR